MSTVTGFIAPGQPNTVPATAADQYLYSTAAGVWALGDLTLTGRSLINVSWSSGTQVPSLTAASTAAMLTVGTAANNLVQLNASAQLPAVSGVLLTGVQLSDAELTAIAGLTSSADQVPYFTGSGTAALFTATTGGRALAGVSWVSGTQVPSLTAAGTAGMLTVGTAANNLVQLDVAGKLPAVDGSQLTNLPAAVPTPGAADLFPYSTGASTWTLGAITAAGRALIDDADAATQRTTLGLGTAATQASTAFQTADATLTAVASWTWTSGTEVKTLTAADTFGTLNVGTSANNLVQLDGTGKLPAVDGSQLTGIAAGSGETLKKTFSQASNGFTAGQVIRHNGTSWVTAQANSAANAEVFGIVDTVGDPVFSVTFSGYISGLTGLTAGAGHFLSPSSAGAITATDPTTSGQVSKPVLVAITTSTGVVQIQRGYVIP